MYIMDRNSSLKEYEKAMRIGKRDFSANIYSGNQGYLMSFETMLENVEIIGEKNIGLIDIPTKKIAGTYYQSRALSFSKNYYPLLDSKTEFANKWCSLLEAQYSEGIRDPIEVYEYLNWYYVVEGNKRASVMKFLNAFSVKGTVKRIIPEWDEFDNEIRIYYEFMDFFANTGINTIWFTKENSFDRLYTYIKNYRPTLKTITDKNTDFSNSIYEKFRKYYHALGGKKLETLTTGDAFLKFLDRYGILENSDERDYKLKVKETINECSEEIQKDQSSGFWNIPALIGRDKKVKVAFVYNTAIKESAWTYSHELGRKYIEKKYSGQIDISCFENINAGTTYQHLIKMLEKEEYDLVFSTSFDFLNEQKKSKFQNVNFMYFSGYQIDKNINTYFGRMYEPRFLSGMIAGAMTMSNQIGYVAPFGIPEVIMGIDAFALGAKSVNPNAVINVTWTNTWNNETYEKNSAKYLIKEKDCDVLTHHQDSPTVMKEADKYGVYSIGYHYDMKEFAPKNYLTSVVWNWGKYYERIINDFLNGSDFSFFDLFLGANKTEIKKFWGGLKSGIVDILPMTNLNLPHLERIINMMKLSIINQEFHPFTGPVYDRNGELKIEKNKVISDEELFAINWFVDNVQF
ncbi:MAG: BMP family ABC transporter substrate-binding protein [Thermotogae bacterium]|nr:BMP family ABC transporter substrate-binding protein [Thermotogota bacterium]